MLYFGVALSRATLNMVAWQRIFLDSRNTSFSAQVLITSTSNWVPNRAWRLFTMVLTSRCTGTRCTSLSLSTSTPAMTNHLSRAPYSWQSVKTCTTDSTGVRIISCMLMQVSTMKLDKMWKLRLADSKHYVFAVPSWHSGRVREWGFYRKPGGWWDSLYGGVADECQRFVAVVKCFWYVSTVWSPVANLWMTRWSPPWKRWRAFVVIMHCAHQITKGPTSMQHVTPMKAMVRFYTSQLWIRHLNRLVWASCEENQKGLESVQTLVSDLEDICDDVLWDQFVSLCKALWLESVKNGGRLVQSMHMSKHLI